ncbi:unnamed protein product [Mytilus coruscus]|uniref:Endonuclease/exonuclease/phosphatase domain-containing protein n=1 Tax=Mytilus coruscus TaxID=42192 RepID=A0A6J8B4H2_MYTCO|nr:unnamed protein product [Mytilus coruscus]
MKSEITNIRSENNEVAENMQRVQNNLDELQEKHLDLQIRSMRENLVFTGIPMTTENEESDTTEGILKVFMTEHMTMETEIDFHRAHRFGQLNERKNRDGTTFKTKPIVCRFESFKDREIVRKSATNIKGTTFSVSEQFPKEINERRKKCHIWYYLYTPENTTYASDEAFSEIEFEFQNFSKNNDYMCLLGDFDSRTATLKDFHETEDTDDTQFNEISDINVFSDICIIDDMNISRFGKDSIGRMTCKNKSVVDYMICTCNVLENILDFAVQEFCRLFSDVHSPTSLTLSCENKKHSDFETNNFTPKFGKWKCEKTLDFRDNLDREMIEKLFFKIQSLKKCKRKCTKTGSR